MVLHYFNQHSRRDPMLLKVTVCGLWWDFPYRNSLHAAQVTDIRPQSSGNIRDYIHLPPNLRHVHQQTWKDRSIRQDCVVRWHCSHYGLSTDCEHITVQWLFVGLPLCLYQPANLLFPMNRENTFVPWVPKMTSRDVRWLCDQYFTAFVAQVLVYYLLLKLD